MNISSKKVIAGLATLASATIVAVATVGAGAAVAPKAPPADFAAQPGSDADASAVFGVLDRAPNREDRANAAIVQFGEEEPWVQVAGARVVADTQQGTVWLTPTTDGRVCLSVEIADYTGHTCDTISRARTIGVVIEIAGKFTGIVPDGTKGASISRPDGGIQELALDHGVFETQALHGKLVVEGSDGSYQLDI